MRKNRIVGSHFLCLVVLLSIQAPPLSEAQSIESDFQRDVYEEGLNEPYTGDPDEVHLAFPSAEETRRVPELEATHVDKLPEDPERRQDGRIQITKYLPKRFKHLKGTYYYPEETPLPLPPPVSPPVPPQRHVDHDRYHQKTQMFPADYKHADQPGPEFSRMIPPNYVHWAHPQSLDNSRYHNPAFRQKHAERAGPQQTRMIPDDFEHRSQRSEASYSMYLHPREKHIDAPGHANHTQVYWSGYDQHVSRRSQRAYTQIYPASWKHRNVSPNRTSYEPPPPPPPPPAPTPTPPPSH